MRFNDSLDTVLAADISTPVGAQLAWRQLVDLVGRGRAPASDEVLARLRLIRERVPVAVRGSSARALIGATPPAALVRLFSEEAVTVAAPVLRSARLSDVEWTDMLAALTPQARAVLRHRRDLSPAVRRALDAFGPVDFVIAGTPGAPVPEPEVARARAAEAPPAIGPDWFPPAAEPTAPEPPEPAPAARIEPAPEMPVAAPEPAPRDEPPPPTRDFVALGTVARSIPAVAEAMRRQDSVTDEVGDASGPFAIADIVARIDAFRRTREARPAPAPSAPASAPGGFDFETDAAGIIRWVDGAERAPLIGLSLEYGAAGIAHLDGAASGAFRKRAAIDNARLQIGGTSSVAGDWRISATPAFDRASGRFIGYRGLARRPRREEQAERGDARTLDALRELVHELRTPTNAIAGFAEMIESAVKGPVPAAYQTMARSIVDQARALLGAIDDLDVAARIDAVALDLSPGAVALPALMQAIVDDLAPLAALRRARVALDLPAPLVAHADGRAVERLLARLLAALIGALSAGEVLSVSGAVAEGMALLTFNRPAALLREPAVDTGPAPEPADAEAGAPLLGVDFTLRLARNLARELGGTLSVGEAALSLRLPLAGGEEAERRSRP